MTAKSLAAFAIITFSLLFFVSSDASAQTVKKPITPLRTTTVYTESTKSSDLQVFPYLSGNKRKIVLDFQSKSLDKMEYIYYNLNYDTDEPETLRGVEGKFIPEKKDFRFFMRIPYIRRELITGTCSGKVCRYDANPRKLNITVKSKLKKAKSETTTVLSINY